MSRAGLDWYKREPLAYLTDTQGLTAREHAVYSVVIELLYVHGGEINNDPKWIGGWISDMGIASIRNTLAQLAQRECITLEITEEKISQKRAKNEAKTKQKLRENAEKNGKKGGEISAKKRSDLIKNNRLGEASASTSPQADKIREDKSIKREDKSSPKKEPSPVEILSEVASPKVAADFVAYRREIKKPMTARMARAMVNKIGGHRNPDAVFNESMANGWQGVFPDKVSQAGGKQQSDFWSGGKVFT